MELKTIRLSELKPLERNVRKHGEKQIEEMVRSVGQFGQTRAIVADEDGNILIGNGLYLALVKMGWDAAQCYIIEGLSETEKKKLVLSDNQIYKLGADDYDEIRSFINDITVMGDFDIAGFDEFVLEIMTMSDDEKEESLEAYGTVTDSSLASSGDVPVAGHEEDAWPRPSTIICPSCGEVILVD